MKRVKSLLVCLCSFALLFLVTGCTNKTAITSDNFKSKLEGKGYVVQDVTSQFTNVEYVKTALVAQKADLSYQIEFYVLDNEDNAQSFYENNKKVFEESEGSSSAHTSVDLANYSKYTLVTNGEYKLISRIDNTMIYLNLDEANKDEVDEIVKELGY